MAFPRVDPDVFDQVAQIFTTKPTADGGLTQNQFLALVLLPALDRMGAGFDHLTLRVPGDSRSRFQATDWVDGSLWLIGRRGSDRLVEVRAAQVNFR